MLSVSHSSKFDCAYPEGKCKVYQIYSSQGLQGQTDKKESPCFIVRCAITNVIFLGCSNMLIIQFRRLF